MTTLSCGCTITGTELENLSWHDGKISALDYSPNGRYLVSAGEDDVVLIWDMSDLLEASSD
jgi:WD40 repeat protein